MRSSQQAKDKKMTLLETECNAERLKVISIEKSFEGERENYRKQASIMETRNNDLHRKVRLLEFDFG